MARPLKQNADWFKHDKDMRDDPKVKALRRKFGLTGYAVYVMMIEIMVDSDGFSTPENPISIELSAGDIGIDPGKLLEILDYCVQLQLFERNQLYEINTAVLSSRRLKLDMQAVLDARNLDRESFRRRKYTEKSREEKSREEGEKEPPFSAPPSPQEKDFGQQINVDGEGNPLIIELLQIHKSATGVDLAIPAEEMRDLLAIFRKYDGPTVVSAYRLCQTEKPGKPFRFFLDDFAMYYAKVQKQEKSDETKCPECHVDLRRYKHVDSCTRGKLSATPGPTADDFEDDPLPAFPEAK